MWVREDFDHTSSTLSRAGDLPVEGLMESCHITKAAFNLVLNFILRLLSLNFGLQVFLAVASVYQYNYAVCSLHEHGRPTVGYTIVK